MRNNVALCAADNSDRYWRFGSGGAKLCLEADEDWLQALPQCAICMCYSLPYRRRPLTISLHQPFLTPVYDAVNLADEYAVSGRKSAGDYRLYSQLPGNSVLLIACIPLPKTIKQCFNLCLSRAGNVNGFAVHCADSAGSGTGNDNVFVIVKCW